jgi:hypothetical protein
MKNKFWGKNRTHTSTHPTTQPRKIPSAQERNQKSKDFLTPRSSSLFFSPLQRLPEKQKGDAGYACHHTSALNLFLAEQATNKRDAARAAALLLVLALAARQHVADGAKAQAAEQFVDTEATKQAVDEAAETKTVEQLADEVEHTCEQESDSRDDLEERLGEQAPERVELLLGVRHVADLLLRVVNGRDDSRSKLLKVVRELVFLRGCLAGLLAALGLCGDAAIGIETAERAVAVVKDARAFFDEGLDVVDEFFFVELVAGSAVGLFDVLRAC